MQERPCGATDWASSSVAPPTLHHASIVRLAGGSRPLIGSNRRNRRFLLRCLLKRRGRTYRTYKTYRTGRLMPPCMYSDLFVAP